MSVYGFFQIPQYKKYKIFLIGSRTLQGEIIRKKKFFKAFFRSYTAVTNLHIILIYWSINECIISSGEDKGKTVHNGTRTWIAKWSTEWRQEDYKN